MEWKKIGFANLESIMSAVVVGEMEIRTARMGNDDFGGVWFRADYCTWCSRPIATATGLTEKKRGDLGVGRLPPLDGYRALRAYLEGLLAAQDEIEEMADDVRDQMDVVWSELSAEDIAALEADE